MYTLLDNEVSAFRKAAAEKLDQKGSIEISPNIPIRDFVDPVKLQSRLDRFAELKFEPYQLQYLETLGFESQFLDWLATGDNPDVKVRWKGKDIKVSLSGSSASLHLWEAPIYMHMTELYHAGIIDESLDDVNVIIEEGIRRFQAKMVLIRGEGIRFVEAGSKYKFAPDWYGLLVMSILGDSPNQLVGTSNLETALSYGMKPFESDGYGKVFDWVPPPSWNIDEAVRSVVIGGDPTAFRMAHLQSHFQVAVPEIVFEWSRDLTCDVGLTHAPLHLKVANA